MTAVETDESQAGYEDGSAPGGPGAPTPLSALEVIELVGNDSVAC